MKSVILLGVLALVMAAPASVVAQTPITEVYAYASDGTPLNWIVFTPAGSGPWPAVLVVHGGNFFGGEPGDAGVTTCAQSLANAGYAAFAIDYRLAPPGSIRRQHSSGRFPEQYDDVHLAIQAARTNSRSNGKVGAVGGSAGGTHAAWTAATGMAGDDRLDVAVCLSGAYDFSDFNPDENLGFFIEIVTNYVGVDASNEAALRAASPAWNLDTSVAPLFMIDTEEDLMPGIQLDDMVAQLDAAGVQNYESMRLPGALHSFAYWSDIQTEAIAFLEKGFATPSPTP
ncbi:MAG: alpha/beta hydrolase, partial [Verrucomicrobiota bacterium]|nr:alpha/beta hydrolase [Verrucomicrobiota bacterium]